MTATLWNPDFRDEQNIAALQWLIAHELVSESSAIASIRTSSDASLATSAPFVDHEVGRLLILMLEQLDISTRERARAVAQIADRMLLPGSEEYVAAQGVACHYSADAVRIDRASGDRQASVQLGTIVNVVRCADSVDTLTAWTYVPAPTAPGDAGTSSEAVRPILFLGIHGVLSPLTDEPPLGFRRFVSGDTTLVMNFVHGRWIQELAEEYEVVWASSWERAANTHVARMFGIPECQYVEFAGAPHGLSWKLPRIRELSRDRPVAWIDDELDDAERGWARQRSAPTLLIKTDAAIGWERSHIDELLAWTARLNPAREEKYRAQVGVWGISCVALCIAMFGLVGVAPAAAQHYLETAAYATFILVAGLLAGIIVQPEKSVGDAAIFCAKSMAFPALLVSFVGGISFPLLFPIIWLSLAFYTTPFAMLGRWVAHQWHRGDRRDAWDIRWYDLLALTSWFAALGGVIALGWMIGPESVASNAWTIIGISAALGVVGGLFLRIRRPWKEGVITAIALACIPTLLGTTAWFSTCSANPTCNTNAGTFVFIAIGVFVGAPIALGFLVGRGYARAMWRIASR